jgi:hypothetical membrane protein
MSTRSLRPESPWMRWAALPGLVGPALFILTVITIAAMQDGYSHVWQAISELGGVEGKYAAFQNVNFLMLGLSVVALSWALHHRLGGAVLAPALLAVFGLSGGIAQGLLPCDAGCRGATLTGLLHNITGITGFIAVILAMTAFARRWQLDPIWRGHARFTRQAAALAVAGLVSFIIVSAALPTGPRGLLQRVFVGALFVWLMVTSWRLHTRQVTVA